MCFPILEARAGLGHILTEVPELFAELGLNGDLKYCIGVQGQRLTTPEVLHARGEDGAQHTTQRGEIASFTNNASSAVHIRLPTLQNVGEALRDFPDAQDTVAYTFSAMFLCCGRRGKTRSLLQKFSPLVAGLSDPEMRGTAPAQISRYLDLEGDPAASAQVWQKFSVQDPSMLAQLSWGKRANASGRLSPIRLGVLGVGSLLAHAQRKVLDR